MDGDYGESPLGASARVRRGFFRAGALLGGLTLIIGLGAAGIGAAGQYEQAEQKLREARCLEPVVARLERDAIQRNQLGPVLIENSPCGFRFHMMPTTRVREFLLRGNVNELNAAINAGAIYAALAVLVAALTLGAVYALGWAISGFFRD